MRDIRARIAKRHGVELSDRQIEELAAKRLEAILDPRTVNPALLDALRRSAGEPGEASSPPSAASRFDETTLYDSRNGLLRAIRRLLRPLLNLFYDSAALDRTLLDLTRQDAEAAAREVERERRQVEWNALHFDLLQRLVREVSRTSLEMHSLSLRVESLAAKLDFNERRVRGLENTTPQGRPPARAAEPAMAIGPVAVTEGGDAEGSAADGALDGVRRKRRRRRGRRGGTGTSEAAAADGEASSGANIAERETSAGDVSHERDPMEGPPHTPQTPTTAEERAEPPQRPEPDARSVPEPSHERRDASSGPPPPASSPEAQSPEAPAPEVPSQPPAGGAAPDAPAPGTSPDGDPIER